MTTRHICAAALNCRGTGGIYDTKCLARSLTTRTPATPSTAPIGPLLPDTSLGGLFTLFNASAATQQVRAVLLPNSV